MELVHFDSECIRAVQGSQVVAGCPPLQGGQYVHAVSKRHIPGAAVHTAHSLNGAPLPKARMKPFGFPATRHKSAPIAFVSPDLNAVQALVAMIGHPRRTGLRKEQDGYLKQKLSRRTSPEKNCNPIFVTPKTRRHNRHCLKVLLLPKMPCGCPQGVISFWRPQGNLPPRRRRERANLPQNATVPYSNDSTRYLSTNRFQYLVK